MHPHHIKLKCLRAFIFVSAFVVLFVTLSPAILLVSGKKTLHSLSWSASTTQIRQQMPSHKRMGFSFVLRGVHIVLLVFIQSINFPCTSEVKIKSSSRTEN